MCWVIAGGVGSRGGRASSWRPTSVACSGSFSFATQGQLGGGDRARRGRLVDLAVAGRGRGRGGAGRRPVSSRDPGSGLCRRPRALRPAVRRRCPAVAATKSGLFGRALPNFTPGDAKRPCRRPAGFAMPRAVVRGSRVSVGRDLAGTPAGLSAAQLLFSNSPGEDGQERGTAGACGSFRARRLRRARSRRATAAPGRRRAAPGPEPPVLLASGHGPLPPPSDLRRAGSRRSPRR